MNMCSVNNQILTAIRRPISTEKKITPKKAPMHAIKSNLSHFQIRYAPLMSIKLSTAEIMIDARIAFGVYLNKGVISNNVSNTTIDITILDTAVLQPAMKLTADLEKDPAHKTTLFFL